MTDHSQTKEKILFTIRRRGPSLPVHIAKEIGQSILFTSAFLSELLSEKRIEISNLRVGSSPVYFLKGQEPQLEKFSQYLKSKEKDAFMLLKERKFLKDNEQDPAIRVAIRAIKDFAVPFKKQEEIFWRYYTIPESQLTPQKITVSEPEIKQEEIKPQLLQLSTPLSKENVNGVSKEKSKDLEIFDKKPTQKREVKKRLVKKTSEKKNEKFFNKIKEFLENKSVKISGIEGFSKDDLTLKVINQGKETLLVAYNKKRIAENDIIKAHQKALEYNLPYIILSLGEPLKKLTNLIDAVKSLEGIKKVE